MKASDLVPKRIYDEKAQTVKEFARELGLGISHSAKLLHELLEEKRVEQVYKRVGTHVVAAYRPVKKNSR